MKNFLLLTGIALFGLTSFAQEKEKKGLEGAWFATSQVGYQQTKTGDTKSTNVMVLPIVGCFISPSVAVAAGVGYINIKSETGSITSTNTGILVFEPMIRKYYNIAGSLYFFGQLAAPIMSGKEKESEMKVTQYGLAVSSGFDFFVTKRFSVEFSYDLANITSTTLNPKTGDNTTITNFSLAHVASADPVYIDALGGSMPNLTTPLSFGFKFVF